MSKNDLKFITIIGAAVGLLIQPILANVLPSNFQNTASRIFIFAVFLILAPFALWVASVIAKIRQGIYQFAQFAAVGALNTFIDLGVLNLEIFLYGSLPGTMVFAALKTVSFLCATTNSFLWNKYWTFGSHGKADVRQVGSFYVIAAIGWALNVGGATIVKVVGPPTGAWVDLVAPLAGVAISFAWDFFGYKHLVFVQ
ncbi:MAG: GtrA family protein [Patescibacteria group bacterium]|nr:GtrA family protein [Patescibacteria group bacterium]